MGDGMIRYTCPHCGKTQAVQSRSDAPYRPFCCKRCQLIDLGKWIDGEYVISDPILPDQDVADLGSAAGIERAGDAE